MRALWGFIGFAIVAAVLIIGARFLMHEPKKKESALMTDADVALYRRAARLLGRMVYSADLNDIAGDILSPGTQKDIEAWLGDYKKELKKNAR